MRTGVTLTFRTVVIALILLSTALTVMLYFSGSLQDFGNVISGEQDTRTDQLARESCLTEKQQLCQQDLGRQNWYDVAEYDGQACANYWPNSEPPGCE